MCDHQYNFGQPCDHQYHFGQPWNNGFIYQYLQQHAILSNHFQKLHNNIHLYGNPFFNAYNPTNICNCADCNSSCCCSCSCSCSSSCSSSCSDTSSEYEEIDDEEGCDEEQYKGEDYDEGN